MQYEPIKRLLGRFFSGPVCMRIIYYTILDIILLRTWHVKKTLKKISRHLPVSSSVLDAGSGPGQYTWFMGRKNRLWTITGVDIDSSMTDECRKFFSKTSLSGRVRFITSGLETFTEPDKFDLIISIDVMEHIQEDETVFYNFFRSLRSGGILLISTPSDLGGSDVHSGDDKSFISEHVRDGYNMQEIKNKLASAGFNDIEGKYTYGKPGNISWHLTMKYPVIMLNRSYLFFLVLPIYYLVFFPVSIILNIFDLCFEHKTGTGLLITAKKA
ncbi:MAG TPA: class I SAM-dependent methyltransferase [Bacteroidales bacterium]|nr:class I SAM-dependent methyltransferase [Bacteroidales bacterium]